MHDDKLLEIARKYKPTIELVYCVFCRKPVFVDGFGYRLFVRGLTFDDIIEHCNGCQSYLRSNRLGRFEFISLAKRQAEIKINRRKLYGLED